MIFSDLTSEISHLKYHTLNTELHFPSLFPRLLFSTTLVSIFHQFSSFLHVHLTRQYIGPQSFYVKDPEDRRLED